MQKMYSVLSNIFDKEVINIEFFQFNRLKHDDKFYVKSNEPSYIIYFSDNTETEIKLKDYIFKLIEYALAWKNTQS